MIKKVIKHYYPSCIGCGACCQLCPDYFRLNQETYKAELIDGVISEEVEGGSEEAYTERTIEVEALPAELEVAVNACPIQVIKIEDERV